MAASDEETHARVEAVLRSYGAHAERWPVADRAAVSAAVQQDPLIAALRQREAALDRMMDRAPRHVPAMSLFARIQAATAQQPTRWQALLTILFGEPGSAGVWRPASALGAAVMLGVVVGSTWSSPVEEQVAAADFLSVAFAQVFDDDDLGSIE
jgi:hypothetical protein